jgi:16S rRNA (guanine527-N7)-methyltransferase|tara:strand:- start:734 stop:1321 length:588 start_codon:yes stop_codon:yes gene_type:complete
MPRAFSDEQEHKIKTFINLALDFNKTHNIFSREAYDEVYENDILDCKPLIDHIKKNKSVLDLGSGGGFPGILLSITRPENKISLLESNNKKCYFLKKVTHELNLKNTKIINKTITKKNELGKFDIITSRAFATIKKTIDLTKTNTHQNTKYLLLKGKVSNIKKELKDIDKNMFRYEIINQDTTKERNIVSLCKDE